jgi:hypothetical protein
MEKLHELWIQSASAEGSAVVFTCTLLLLIILSYLYALSLKRRVRPPGPRPWPIVGNFPSMSGDTPHRSLHKLATEYGGLMYLRFGN